MPTGDLATLGNSSCGTAALGSVNDVTMRRGRHAKWAFGDRGAPILKWNATINIPSALEESAGVSSPVHVNLNPWKLTAFL